MRGLALLAAAIIGLSTLAVEGAGTRAISTQPATDGVSAFEPKLAPAPRTLIAACRTSARTLGYPVPCPTRIPAGLTETGTNGPTGCALHIIGPGGIGECAKSWRGWVVGSSATRSEHLVITASPAPVRNDARVVNGPAWYPKARVEPLTWLTINGRRVRAVFVPQATNDGSAFAHHVVLIWTVGQHTYGVGFHDVRGLQRTLELDEELVESIRLVGP